MGNNSEDALRDGAERLIRSWTIRAQDAVWSGQARVHETIARQIRDLRRLLDATAKGADGK